MKELRRLAFIREQEIREQNYQLNYNFLMNKTTDNDIINALIIDPRRFELRLSLPYSMRDSERGRLIRKLKRETGHYWKYKDDSPYDIFLDLTK